MNICFPFSFYVKNQPNFFKKKSSKNNLGDIKKRAPKLVFFIEKKIRKGWIDF